MLRLALAGEPVFSVSTVERDRPAPSYTYDTLDAFARLHPGDALFFLLGADQYADMKNWHRASELARLCRVVVLGRPGTKRPRVYRGHDPRRVRFLDVIEVAISSRQIRARLAKAESVGYMLPAPVQAYVQRHRLYRRNTHE
jgi:nicotinate-nucleotide adenylyltransferase